MIGKKCREGNREASRSLFRRQSAEQRLQKALDELELSQLARVKAYAGAGVPVGQTIAWIVRPGEIPPTEELESVSGRKMSAVPSAAALSTPLSSTHSGAQSTSKPIKILLKRGGSQASAA